VIHINNISLSFGEKEIFERINWFLTEKSRIGLVGDNGQGKTTLTRLMSKAEEPTSEELKYGLNVKMAFFSQESAGRTSEYFLSGRRPCLA